MGTNPVIIFEEGRDDPLEVSLVQHDDVVQALAAQGSDPAFDEGILPGTLRCDQHFLDAQVGDAPAEDRAVATVAVPDQVAWRLVKGEGLHYLPSDPVRGRMRGDVDMDDAAAVVAEDNETVEQAKGDGRHDA